MMILTGIMGMESMAIFSFGTFLSISFRLVMPDENRDDDGGDDDDDGDDNDGGDDDVDGEFETGHTLCGGEGEAHGHQQGDHDRDQRVPHHLQQHLILVDQVKNEKENGKDKDNDKYNDNYNDKDNDKDKDNDNYNDNGNDTHNRNTHLPKHLICLDEPKFRLGFNCFPIWTDAACPGRVLLPLENCNQCRSDEENDAPEEEELGEGDVAGALQGGEEDVAEAPATSLPHAVAG